MLTMDISQRYIFTDRHTLYKTVDILLHVTAGKLVNYVQTTIHTAFNNCMRLITACVAIGIYIHYIKAYTTESTFVLKTC
jgi:hypothetical protein